jgi:hypothetical protein
MHAYVNSPCALQLYAAYPEDPDTQTEGLLSHSASEKDTGITTYARAEQEMYFSSFSDIITDNAYDENLEHSRLL